jgi:hypothetical protein
MVRLTGGPPGAPTWISRHLSAQFSFRPLCRLHIQHKVNGCPQEVGSVGLGDQRVDGAQSAVWQLQIISQHDNGNRRMGPLNLIGNEHAIQEYKLVIEHNCIDGLRRKKPQAIVAIGRVY